MISIRVVNRGTFRFIAFCYKIKLTLELKGLRYVYIRKLRKLIVGIRIFTATRKILLGTYL